jgi:hypothetical protein
MVAIMDLVVAVILVTAVAVPITLNANTALMNTTSKSIYNMIPLFLVLAVIFLAARMGGFIGYFKRKTFRDAIPLKRGDNEIW